ncbi:uncharacterized protein N7498_009661 [Penicillium cinerascens]|uniref:Uncharacterized protein n=1 Tax=Penicillium cinerascens TaxID=70096 RepID=A0A9W9M5P3_9EURO|nr:uncharacterized protein N7498_009661 [Penicillium cinerascens]KAJ5190676.1 hypothetical protein N7498_009661 [Penicillium cinerascens]
MGLNCMYPKNQGRNKRQERDKSRRATIQRNAIAPERIACGETEPCVRNRQVDYGKESAWDDLYDITFDNSSIDESLLTSLIMDTPMHHGRSSSSSSGTGISAVDLTTSESSFPAGDRSATLAPPGQLPELSTANTCLTSLLGPSATDSAGNLGYWAGPHTAHGVIAWAMNTDEHATVRSTSEPPSLELWDKTRTESDSYCCLMSSISFVERLVSNSASRKNRIDLLLADVRNAIETLAIFIACEGCAARVEQNMLLAMAARQISLICRETANCYKAMHMCSLDDTNSSQQKPEPDTSAGPVEISVSTYRVKRHERLHLLKSLVTLQILELQQHVNKIKSRYRNRPNQGQVEALIEAEDLIKIAQVVISHS